MTQAVAPAPDAKTTRLSSFEHEGADPQFGANVAEERERNTCAVVRTHARTRQSPLAEVVRTLAAVFAAFLT